MKTIIEKQHQAHFTRVELVHSDRGYYVRTIGDMFEPNLVRFSKNFKFHFNAKRSFEKLCADAEEGLIV